MSSRSSSHRPLAAAAAAILASAGAPTALAGPLDKSHVPADAAWVVHFDAEAMMKSSISKVLLEGPGHMDLDELKNVKEEYGIDPLTDIKDATIFGRDTEGEDAVAILTTTAAVDDALEKLKAHEQEYSVSKEGGYDVYEWSDEGHSQYGLIRKAGADRRLIYLARDKDRLIAAADIAGGHGESLRGRKDSALAAEPGAGAILFVATDVMPGREHGEEMSMVLGKAKSLRLEIGESGENCYGDVELTMASSEDATNVVQILQGLQAMARMFCQNNPDLAPLKELMDAETLSSKEASIVAQLKYPTAKLVEAIKAAEKEEDEGKDADGDESEHHEKEHHKGDHGKKPL